MNAVVALGRSGPNLEPGTMRVYLNGLRNGLNIGGKVGPCRGSRRRWVLGSVHACSQAVDAASIYRPKFQVRTLRVEYAERGTKYGILFIFSPFDEYSPLEYVRVPVIYRVYQAEYVILILAAVSQEYVNTYSTPRVRTRPS